MQSTNNTIDINTIKQLFQNSADIKFQAYTFNQQKVYFIKCEGMIDQQLLNAVVVQRVENFCKSVENELSEENILTELHVPDLKRIMDKEELMSLVYKGQLLLFFETNQLLFSVNIAKKPNRNPEESKLEVIVKGPRDNFIEDIATNIALIRKRLPTNSLCVEKIDIGRRSKTTVAILYFEDIANEEILDQIRQQIQKIDTDIILSGELLMERINHQHRLIPRTNYTARADFSVQALVRGRFIILVDGVSYAIMTPVNFFLLLKSGEDNEYPIIVSSIERLLRIVGLQIGLLLPAFWLALTTIHQDQLPFQLLATVVQSSTGLPLPSALEMLLMLLMFELFREAGLRLPTILGGTISVVGGLIIGDAAIRAGVTSPAMIVIIAISTIATFTLVNQSLVLAISILRICTILITAFLGLFGFFISLYFVILVLANIRTFGVPYLNAWLELNWSTFLKTLFRLSPKKNIERPIMLNTKDKTHTNEVKNE